MQVKGTDLNSIRRLAIGQEPLMIEDAAYGSIRIQGLGLLNNGRIIRLNRTVNIPKGQQMCLIIVQMNSFT